MGSAPRGSAEETYCFLFVSFAVFLLIFCVGKAKGLYDESCVGEVPGHDSGCLGMAFCLQC